MNTLGNDEKSTIPVKQCVIELFCDKPLLRLSLANPLRGAIAAACKDNPLFHHHDAAGDSIYSYALIQYKLYDGRGLIVGIADGAAALGGLNLQNQTLLLNHEPYRIEEQRLTFRTSRFGLIAGMAEYRFATPWLALNQKNYELFRKQGGKQQQQALLERVLIGNLLSMSKGLGYDVTARLQVKFIAFRETETALKGNPMAAFWGEFAANFAIPEFWGIGKSVARGFGTVVPNDAQL